MSAAGLVSAHPQSSVSGLQSMQLRRDLAAVADVIEVCFAPTLDAGGRSAIQEMRVLSRSGPLLGLLGRLSSEGPLAMQGFVWFEDNRLVGNVSLSPAGMGNGWIIANVAVLPDYRRRGIARQLVRAALDAAARIGAPFALLQVESNNAGARRLYEELGFREQRTFTRWRRGIARPVPVPDVSLLPLRPLIRAQANQLYALAERVRPNVRGGLGWLNPTSPAALRPARWGSLRQLVSGRRRDYWVIEGDSLDAALIAEYRTGCATVLFDLLVSPDRVLEESLLQSAVRRLGGQYRPLLTQHPTDDDRMNEALRRAYFRPERTLVHMIAQF